MKLPTVTLKSPEFPNGIVVNQSDETMYRGLGFKGIDEVETPDEPTTDDTNEIQSDSAVANEPKKRGRPKKDDAVTTGAN